MGLFRRRNLERLKLILFSTFVDDMKIKCLIVGELATNCYLLFSEKEAAVIDPGGEAEKILEEIKSSGAKLKYIINTHYHPDHTLANEKISEKTGAEILIHQAEKDFIEFKVSQFLKEGDNIKIGETVLKVIHTPGHTKGSICLTSEDLIHAPEDHEISRGCRVVFGTGFRSPRKRGRNPANVKIPRACSGSFIFTGDTLFKDGQGRTDLPGGSAEEIEESLEKLKKLFKPGILIYPGHGDIFKIK